MQQLTDRELYDRVARARGLAHRAPFAEWSKDHKGHSCIVGHTSAWATFSAAFVELTGELQRRKMPMPPCDCPPGAHDA